MKTEIIRCDCCGAKVENDRYFELTLPLVISDGENEGLTAHDADICLDCSNKICSLYYQVAREHGHSGLLLFTEGE